MQRGSGCWLDALVAGQSPLPKSSPERLRDIGYQKILIRPVRRARTSKCRSPQLQPKSKIPHSVPRSPNSGGKEKARDCVRDDTQVFSRGRPWLTARPTKFLQQRQPLPAPAKWGRSLQILRQRHNTNSQATEPAGRRRYQSQTRPAKAGRYESQNLGLHVFFCKS